MSDSTVKAPPLPVADLPKANLPTEIPLVGEAPFGVVPPADGGIIGAPSHVIPSRLAIIAEMKAVNGYVHITRLDGKAPEIWPAERMGMMAQDCLRMLDDMTKAELRTGKPIAASVRAQVMELCEKATKAYMDAKHQMESVGRHDHETKAVGRMVDNLKWQKGQLPERGEYTEAHLPEENNIKHYMARFPGLREIEIAAVLRADHLPWNLRVKMLRMMNGKRMAEEAGQTVESLKAMLARGETPASAQQTPQQA